MSIGKKLYCGFGGVLGLLLLLSVVNGLAMRSERVAQEKTTRLFNEQRLTSDIGLQMMQNREFLGSYLLSGDTREAENLAIGADKLQKNLQDAISRVDSADEQGIKNSLVQMKDAEAVWLTSFANPLLDKRKQVDEGNSTVAELQIFYLQFNPGSWLKKSRDPLTEAQNSIARILDAQQAASASTNDVTTTISILFTLLAIGGGAAIAYLISRSITQPLYDLISIARQIGDSGDLDQKVDIERQDEIGELAKTFNNMVSSLKEMAGVSEAIAVGDLTVDAHARSN